MQEAARVCAAADAEMRRVLARQRARWEAEARRLCAAADAELERAAERQRARRVEELRAWSGSQWDAAAWGAGMRGLRGEDEGGSSTSAGILPRR